ncbi:MAG: hypothetical protein FD157_3988, partial [Rhodocyclaceae bacterium]
RREADGRIAIVEPEQDDTIKTDDIIHVREALF